MSFAPKTILVPVDTEGAADPQFAEQAVARACDLAESFGAGLRLVSVVPPPALPAATDPSFDYYANLAGLNEARRDAAKKRLDELAQVATDRKLDALTEVIGDHHSVPKAIAECAEKSGADLIAMSTHARRGISRFLLGSVAEQVLRLAQAPVFLFRPEGADTDENG